MKITKYLQIGFILALLVGCENAVQKVTETTDNSIKNAATSAGTVGAIKYEPLKGVEINTTKLSKEVMPIFTTNCVSCHGATPLQVTGKPNNRFSITDSSATYTNIISNSLVNVGTPALSILLKKATNATTHHGGERIKLISKEYRVIYAWIKAGANNN